MKVTNVIPGFKVEIRLENNQLVGTVVDPDYKWPVDTYEGLFIKTKGVQCAFMFGIANWSVNQRQCEPLLTETNLYNALGLAMQNFNEQQRALNMLPKRSKLQ
jgi:hypothetical protein